MTKNRTPTPVYLDPGMHSGLEVKGLRTKYTVSYYFILTSKYTKFENQYIIIDCQMIHKYVSVKTISTDRTPIT